MKMMDGSGGMVHDDDDDKWMVEELKKVKRETAFIYLIA